jgi:hypothetical protein
MTEITVILKDSDRTYRQKFLMYEDYYPKESDPQIQSCIRSSLKNFQGEPESIQIKIHLEIQ